MIWRHLHVPFRFFCITDDSLGLHPAIVPFKLWDDYSDTPGCFRRLKIFSTEMKKYFGDRILSVDLDCVITGDITSLVERDEDFVIWGEEWRKTKYCGSLFLLRTGSRAQVWEGFNLEQYPPRRDKMYPKGTDQWRISDCLYPGEATYTSRDGIYNLEFDVRVNMNKRHMPKVRAQRDQTRREVGKLNNRIKRVQAELDADLPRKYSSKFRQKKWETLERERQERDYKDLSERRAKLFGSLPENKGVVHRGKKRIKVKGGDGLLPDNSRIVFFNGKYDPSQDWLQEELPWIKDHWR